MTELDILRIPAILISLTIHEYAHGYTAWIKGDDTASLQGRLTLNPFPHLDLLGTLMMLRGPFGWAKPVPVNPNRLANPRRDMGLVALAGPVSNILQAVVGGIILRLILTFAPQTLGDNQIIIAFIRFLIIYFQINLGLAVFNLLPFAPLDGSHIVRSMLPYHKVHKWEEISRFAPQILFGMLIIEWIMPSMPIFTTLLVNPIFRPWFYLWSHIILGSDIAGQLL